MRMIFALPLLLAASCSVDSDSANDQMTLDYDQERIENAARDAGAAARELGTAAANVADSTGRAIGNEVGDIDVDVDVTRNRSDGAGNQAGAN